LWQCSTRDIFIFFHLFLVSLPLLLLSQLSHGIPLSSSVRLVRGMFFFMKLSVTALPLKEMVRPHDRLTSTRDSQSNVLKGGGVCDETFSSRPKDQQPFPGSFSISSRRPTQLFPQTQPPNQKKMPTNSASYRRGLGPFSSAEDVPPMPFPSSTPSSPLLPSWETQKSMVIAQMKATLQEDAVW
jgi:hypothetical protein